MTKLRKRDMKKFHDNENIVHHCAWKIKQTIPTEIDIRDLEQYGYIGLIDAINRYDEGYKTKFITYAHHRIRGAILDGMRQMGDRPNTYCDNKSPLMIEDMPELIIKDDCMDKWTNLVLVRSVIIPYIAMLPLKIRFVLIARYYWGLQDHEIGEILGHSKQVISRYAMKGKNILKERLTQAGFKW